MPPHGGRLPTFAALLLIAACAPPAPPVIDLSAPSSPSSPPSSEACDAAARHRARAKGLLAEGRLEHVVRVVALADKLCPATAAESEADKKAALAELAAPAPPGGGRALYEAGLAAKESGHHVEAQRLFDRALAAIEREARAAQAAPGSERATVALDVPNGISDTIESAVWVKVGGAAALAVAHEKDVSVFDPVTWQVRHLLHHLADVETIAVSPDGRTLATGADDGLRFWDVESGDLTFFDDGDLSEVAWSADGRILVAGDPFRQLLEIRKPGAKAPVRVIALDGKHLDRIMAVAVSARGEQAAVAFHDGEVGVWRISDGKQLWRVKGHDERPRALAWSPDGKLLASAGRSGVKIWAAAGGRAVRTVSTKYAESVTWSQDGKAVVTEVDASAMWLSVATGKGERSVGNTSPHSLAFDPGSKRLAAISPTKVEIWNAESGEEEHRIQVHAEGVRAVAWTPGGEAFVSGGWDGSVRVWDARRGAPIRIFMNDDAVLAVAVSPDGHLIAAGTTGARTFVWNLATGEEIHRLEGSKGWNNAVAFSRSGKILASASGKVVTLVEVGSYRKIRTLGPTTEEITALALSPDERVLATADQGSMARLWDTGTGQEIASLPMGNMVGSLSWSADGATLLSAGNAPALLDRSGGGLSLVKELTGHETYVDTAAFAPDGKGVASGSADHTVRLWNVASGETTRQMLGHTGIVRSVAFRPDGKWLLSGSEDGSVRLWSLESGRSLALRGVAGTEDAYAFTDGLDGRIELLGEAARAFPVCRIGPVTYRFDLCRDRVELPGLVGKMIAGDPAALEP